MPNPTRSRDLGIPLEGTPGPLNAITDVAGVEVGHSTIIQGEGPLVVGKGPVRTGVTVILPRGRKADAVFAGWHALNGNGELTGVHWIDESGFLEGPIGLTNTHSVGVVRDAIIGWEVKHGLVDPIQPGMFFRYPVVGETYDGILNDINGFHVKAEHVWSALDSAAGGPVTEGAVGGGTGMICYEFKGGIGTSSRQVILPEGEYTLGALVQANYGRRPEFTVAGVPVGFEVPASAIPSPWDAALLTPSQASGGGSIIVVLATDAPLLPHQLKRLTRRVGLGLARLGAYGSHYSGDIFLAFSIANPGAAKRTGLHSLQMLTNDWMNPLFAATVQATEEAILNAMVAAKPVVGINGNIAHPLPHNRLREALNKYGRLV
jgi:L-aminopeptidase/D-esterase-like protein